MIFAFIPRLVKLDLTHTDLTHLADFTFKNFHNLNSIDISHTKLKLLKTNMFVGLKNITKLFILDVPLQLKNIDETDIFMNIQDSAEQIHLHVTHTELCCLVSPETKNYIENYVECC